MFSVSMLAVDPIFLRQIRSVFVNQDLSSPAELPKYVGANLGPTHERAWSCDVRRGSMQRLLGEAVRPVRGTGVDGS